MKLYEESDDEIDRQRLADDGIYVICGHLRDEMLQLNKMIKDGIIKRHRNNKGRLADGSLPDRLDFYFVDDRIVVCTACYEDPNAAQVGAENFAVICECCAARLDWIGDQAERQRLLGQHECRCCKRHKDSARGN